MAGDELPSRPVSGAANLAPPVNEELTRRAMERTPSMAMRAEKEDLKEAAEESFNVIMDLTLDGKVSWVSPSWEGVIGYAGVPCFVNFRATTDERPTVAVLRGKQFWTSLLWTFSSMTKMHSREPWRL